MKFKHPPNGGYYSYYEGKNYSIYPQWCFRYTFTTLAQSQPHSFWWQAGVAGRNKSGLATTFDQARREANEFIKACRSGSPIPAAKQPKPGRHKVRIDIEELDNSL